MLGAVLASLVLQASSAPQKLVEAKKLADDLQYDRAVKVIEAGLAQPEIDRDTLMGLYELAALSWANLDKPAKAREAFQVLLSLRPEYELSKDLPPRTRTPFFEAKTWLAGTTPVSVDVQSIIEAGKLTGLSIVVTDNALVKVKGVRVTITPSGGAPQPSTPSLQDKRTTVALGEDGGAWRVEVQGERGVLLSATGEAKRYVPPVVEPPPVEVVKGPEAPAPKWQQTAGFVVGALGLVGTIGGVAAGLVSSQARARIANAERNSMGMVTGITQREAAQLDATARTAGLAANVLLIAGGALLAGGVVLFVLGMPDAPASAALSFTPGGLVLSGSF